MLNQAVPRYRPSYRADEIDLVLRFAQRGNSLGFMGVAGIGKSNIVNFLSDLKSNAPDKGEKSKQLHFPVVDAIQWQPDKPESLWPMMLDALERATKGLASPNANNKVIPFSNEERSFKALQQQLETICQELKHQVMFILDDFDQVLANGPLPMLEQLNVLRNEGNREYLSYLVFTKRLPHILGRQLPLENKSKFYDLFRYNIYALEPYTKDDALRMLQHLNDLSDKQLSNSQLEQIYAFAGGHAGLLKLVFNIWVEENPAGMKAKFFTQKPEVKHECERIFKSLHKHEQEAVWRASQGKQTPDDLRILDHLARRGMLTSTDPVRWFSPLMNQFLISDEGGV